MQKVYPTNNKPFAFSFAVYSARPERVRVVTYDFQRQNTKYTDRWINIQGERKFRLRFPQSPMMMGFRVNTLKAEQLGVDDSSLRVYGFKVEELDKCAIWMDRKTESFLQFAKEFSLRCGNLSEGIYKSNDGMYIINYMNVITDRKSGKPITTPARIGHQSKIIEVSRKQFQNYTFPQRLVILLHEFSHVWKNPESGKPVSDEVAADINALYIYLSLGYPRTDALLVFSKVFYRHDTHENRRRIKIIEDFIKNFDAGHVKTGASCKK